MTDPLRVDVMEELGTLIREFLSSKYGRESRCHVHSTQQSSGVITFDIMATVLPAEKPTAEVMQGGLEFGD